MLGGYYLGHLYLGISGSLIRIYLLELQNAVHNHTVDSMTMLVFYYMYIDSVLHSTTVDNVELLQWCYLTAQKCYNSLSSENITLLQFHKLFVDESLHHQSSDKILKIFNWDDVNKYFGIYIKDYVNGGTFNNLPDIDKEIYILKQKQLGSFSQSGVDESGIYIKEDTRKGLL